MGSDSITSAASVTAFSREMGKKKRVRRDLVLIWMLSSLSVFICGLLFSKVFFFLSILMGFGFRIDVFFLFDCFVQANRYAKLKQCKLDARREQWLSQGICVWICRMGFLIPFCWGLG